MWEMKEGNISSLLLPVCAAIHNTGSNHVGLQIKVN